ncbi:hypothetical protein HF325_006407 [Metschnikowia pulcherrima]|uniref:Uncharacterized protein n=1 Tax=Metschnikowia pulcherrima TaxID=27326 RepID=A0A8H7L925_9ASCO|nr:hypothetical protein HF325_006407 [Metschnikowia pulcherrima]
MAKGPRRNINDDDENGLDLSVLDTPPQPRRTRRTVSYMEDSHDEEQTGLEEGELPKDAADADPSAVEADNLSDEVPSEPDNVHEDENYDENSENDDVMPARKRARKAARRAERPDGEDSDFQGRRCLR